MPTETQAEPAPDLAQRLKRRQLDAARVMAVKEMMLDPQRLEFARWLIQTGRISDYA